LTAQYQPALPATSSRREDVDEQQVIIAGHGNPQRRSRQMPEGREIPVAVFDESSSTVTAPRLYASQNRIWQALTGHNMDLKKVPTMEFALLSLIAASGATGITQPELTQFSGQDKRSVPHRTDELARKGYIVKNPVQAGKARTSICVHSKFVTRNHFTSSGAVEDVFQEGKFVASGFIPLLYSKLKDAGVVPTREIRKRLVGFPFPFSAILLTQSRVCQPVLGTSELCKGALSDSIRAA
jgi:transcription factor C subunit 3